MPSPFPGMNPFLESPAIWPGFHLSILVALSEVLNRDLTPNYFADIQAFSESMSEGYAGSNESCGAEWLGRQPASTLTIDEKTLDRCIKIQCDPFAQNADSVTVIQIVSPTNKLYGSVGQRSYLAKRKQILNSRTHFIEIDLLRAGERHFLGPAAYESDYLISLSRTEERPSAEVWPTGMQASLPTIPIPLLPGDDDLVINLQQVFTQVYNESGYDRHIRLTDPIPEPKLSDKNAKWIKQFIGP